jgi:lipopolysaccharide/colanic/teichoic acid biosynthesis glycosyltransferase
MRSSFTWAVYLSALVIADALLLVLAFVGAAWLRGNLDLTLGDPEFDPQHYGLIASVVLPGLLLIFHLHGAYTRRNLLGGPGEYTRIISGCTYGMLLVVATSYWLGSTPLVSRGWLLFFWVFAIVLIGAGRFVLRRAAYATRAWGWFVRRILIVGASDQGLAIAQQLHGPVTRGNVVVGFVDDYLSTGARLTSAGFGPAALASSTGRAARSASDGFRVLGHPRAVQELARAHRCDLILVVPSALGWETQRTLAELAATATDLDVRLAPTEYDLTVANVEPAPLGYIPLFRVQPARIVGVDAVLRAAADLSIALLLMIVTAPLLLLLVLWGWLLGIRPILVGRRVLGQAGRPITLHLLNPRISDRLLVRRLPALVSVLRGDLAMVGPKPLLLGDAATYQPWLRLLLSVKPGLTGPWRIVEQTATVEETALADIWWVRNWTIWFHLFVLLQTGLRLARTRSSERGLQRWATVEPALEPLTPVLTSVSTTHPKLVPDR